MTPFPRLFLPLAAIAALAACASPYGSPGRSAPAAAPPAATETGAAPSAAGGANTGGTYPYGKAPAAKAGAEGEAGAQEGIIEVSPEGEVWVKPGATTERYRADIEACHAYAQAQVAHDVRIESDSGAALPDDSSGLGVPTLRSRMSAFERTKRQPILFSNCMEAKGYIRR